jgi:mRNA interferase MazF
MNRGDVVLVHVPFVGTPGGKTRPALIVQSDRLNVVLNETIIAEITSTIRNVAHQVLVEIAKNPGTGLKHDSAVRCERLHTIPKSDVQKIIGQLSPQMMLQVEAALQSALG